MSFTSDPSQPMPPLSAGNVVSAGIQLYRAHFQQYARIALTATLWALVPFLAIIPVFIFFAIVQNYYALLGILIPAWIVLLFYTSAKYLAASAAISRLAFAELTNESETSQQASRYTNARTWRFWAISFLVGLLFFAALIALYILAAIVAGIVLAGTGGLATLFNPDPIAISANPTPFVLTGLIVLLVVLVFLIFSLWLGARFSIAELPLAIEAEVGTATKSIGRSWELTQKHAWRIALVLFITSVITIPIQILMSILSSIIQGLFIAVFPEESVTFQFIAVLIGSILGLVAGIVLLPLWQSIKAVLYADLRRRREGMGLQLRDS